MKGKESGDDRELVKPHCFPNHDRVNRPIIERLLVQSINGIALRTSMRLNGFKKGREFSEGLTYSFRLGYVWLLRHGEGGINLYAGLS